MSHPVSIEPSGRQFTVEAGESVLAAALRQGVYLPYGCRGGQCGACRAQVLAGEVEYPGPRPEALAPGEEAAGVAVLCQARTRGPLRLRVEERRRAQEIPVRTLPCRVVAKELLAPDVMRLLLKLPEGQRLQFLAGQYIEFLLPEGRRRAFSLANAPGDDELLELHVRHVAGGQFSDWLFHTMPERAVLRLEGPLGTFRFVEESSRPVILMAGGTGFAPVKAILEEAWGRGEGRPLHLYWGARARRDLYLDALPRAWAQAYPHFRYTPVLSEPAPEDGWPGRVGLVHAAVAADYPDLADYEVYACGPPAMVYAGRELFTSHGLPPERYYSDAFEYARDPGRTSGTAGTAQAG